jgi:hypothetical protein
MSRNRPVRSQVSGPGLGNPLTWDLELTCGFLEPLTWDLTWPGCSWPPHTCRSGPGHTHRSQVRTPVKTLLFSPYSKFFSVWTPPYWDKRKVIFCKSTITKNTLYFSWPSLSGSCGRKRPFTGQSIFCGCMVSSLTSSNYETTFSRNFANIGSFKFTCCAPPLPVNLLCVLDTTLSPVALSKGLCQGHTCVSCCGVLVVCGTVRLLWWGWSWDSIIRSRCRGVTVARVVPSFTLSSLTLFCSLSPFYFFLLWGSP